MRNLTTETQRHGGGTEREDRIKVLAMAAMTLPLYAAFLVGLAVCVLVRDFAQFLADSWRDVQWMER